MSTIAKLINWIKGGKRVAKESYSFDSSEIDRNLSYHSQELNRIIKKCRNSELLTQDEVNFLIKEYTPNSKEIKSSIFNINNSFMKALAFEVILFELVEKEKEKGLFECYILLKEVSFGLDCTIRINTKDFFDLFVEFKHPALERGQ